MRRIFLLLSLLVAAVSTASAAEIPFRFTDGFICIEARVASTGEPLNLVLDSGAGASVLSWRAAKRLKLKFGPAETVLSVGAEAVAYHLEPVKTTAGNVALPPIPLAVDLSKAEELCSYRVDGLIGIDFFQGRVVQIDYAHRCLRILESAPVLPTAEKLPIKMLNGMLCVPVGVNGSAPRWTRMDTGCNDALHWVVPRPGLANDRQGVTIGFITNPDDTSLTSVSLGSRTLGQVKTSLHSRPLFAGEAGLLGNGMLSRFTVTVDWPHRRVLLDRGAE